MSASAFFSRPLRPLVSLFLLFAVSILSILSISPAVAVSSGTLDSSDNIVLRAQVDEYGAYSDVWGYTAPDGTELAIIGLDFGFSFVDVTDILAPTEVLYVPGGYAVWRDIKTHGPYAYLVDDQAGEGLTVVDLTDPTSPVVVGTHTDVFTRAHNVWVDSDLELLFAGYDAFGDLHVFDLAANPVDPPLVFTFSDFAVHDLYTRDGVGYLAAIFAGTFHTADLTQLPTSMPVLDSIPTNDDATHNVWLTEDGDYALVTDEVATGHITVFDVSDPLNLVEVASYVHPDDPDAIVHNVVIEGDVAYVSWYRAGLEILDISNPLVPTRTGYYDTFPGTGAGFDGAWGVYPFAESGYVYVSDIQSGLLIFEYSNSLGSVVGTVRDANSTDAIEGARVTTAGDVRTAWTDGTGDYELSLNAAEYFADVSAYGYEPAVVSFEVDAAETTIADVDLVPLPTGGLSGAVLASDGGAGLEGALLELVDTPLETIAGASGLYSFPSVPTGPVVLRVRALGYGAAERFVRIEDGVVTNLDLTLDPSIVYEDFESDPLWTVGGADDDATQGQWTRVDPNGTGNPPGSVQTEDDHTPGLGALCFVTGQGPVGGSTGQADVDNGKTTLTTAVYDVSPIADPVVRFYLAYSNDSGSNPGLDEFVVELSEDGGSNFSPVQTWSTNAPAWTEIEIPLADVASDFTQIQMRFVAADEGGPSVVEAAVDDFEIYGREFVADVEPPIVAQLGATLTTIPHPLPKGEGGTIFFRAPAGEALEGEVDRLVLVDTQGRLVSTVEAAVLSSGIHQAKWTGRDVRGQAVPRGVYFALVRANGQQWATKILVR